MTRERDTAKENSMSRLWYAGHQTARVLGVTCGKGSGSGERPALTGADCRHSREQGNRSSCSVSSGFSSIGSKVLS